MNQLPKLPISDAEVFAATRPPSLAEIMRRCEAELTGTALRDTRSAFRFLHEQVGIDLETVLATPDAVRQLLGSLSAARLGVSDKRLANLSSLIRRAVEQLGPKRVWITREIEPAPEWKALLDRIPDRQHAWGLSRLACYCTAKGIAPKKVRSEILIGFQAALEAESLTKDPVNIRKHTISLWNMCGRTVRGWPQTRLASPFKPEAYMYPLEAFPQSFQNEVAAWEHRMTSPDPLDFDAPVRAFRPDTLNKYRFTIRRLASALVREQDIPIEKIMSLEVLFEGKNLEEALRPFIKPGKNAKQDYAYSMATQVRAIAEHFLKLPKEQLDKVDRIVAGLRLHLSTGMGKRNFARLDQFDDEATVQRLLNLPGEQLHLALEKRNPIRRAKGVERALMLSICVFASLRAKNLRQLRLDRNLSWSGEKLFIKLFEDETKNRASLKLQMPEEMIGLLELFVAKHRPLLPGSDGPYLFPGQTGGPRSYSAIRDAVGVKVYKMAGIRVSPHLYRHAIAKIVVERHPELALDVSRRLGHRSVNTTYQSYLGTEGPAASRRINDLLQDVRGEKHSDSVSTSLNQHSRRGKRR
jgi:integrase